MSLKKMRVSAAISYFVVMKFAKIGNWTPRTPTVNHSKLIGNQRTNNEKLLENEPETK